MGKEKTTESRQRAAVKEYLQQYHAARRMKKILEDRHRVLLSELNSPGPGSASRPTSPTHTRQKDGAVSVVFRIAEVEDRIEAQRDEMAKAVLRVMDLIDLLPQNSMERTVAELRHIDCKGWDQIAREVYMSRSAVFNYYNAALDILLGCKRTRKLVEEYNCQPGAMEKKITAP